jgi:hypothetical protein
VSASDVIKTVRFPEKLHANIMQIADDSGETFSAVVRALLRAAIGRLDTGGEPK